MYKVYVTDYVFENFNPEKNSLQDVDCELIPLQCKSAAELIDKAKDADALLNCYMGGIDASVMDAMPNLKVIVRYGIGYNTIDITAATERGIQVANVPDYCLDEVSDHAVAVALSLVRKVTMSHNRIKNEKDYGIGYLKPVLPLRGSKLAILGFGRIGKLIAAKMHPFGCTILFYDPFIPADIQMEGFSAHKVSLDEAYAEADIIILQAPATSENYHMLNAETFAKMRRKPYIVNCARGELIDEKALATALEKGQIAGAGLDVLESMPPVSPDNPLLKFDNVILTPHSAWISANSLAELQRLAALEVGRALKGGVVKSLLNPDYVKHHE
jgi:D-3-phosphoglycerate dehydrogenase